MKIDNKKYYFIRHKPTGLKKVEGQNANFNSVGKLWKGSRIINHLKQFDYIRKFTTLVDKIDYLFSTKKIDDCEVVECELVEIKIQPLRDFINGIEKKGK